MIERIHTAYKGEVYGISFFSYFAKYYSDSTFIPLWKSLIQVEILTADLIQMSLNRHAISYNRDDSLMIEKGLNDAKKWIDLPWQELVETLAQWVEPYEEKYRGWASQATQDIEVFELISAHETAIYECWKAERNGQSGIPHLLAFIKAYTI